MGIINDFVKLKEDIISYKNEGRGIIHYISYNKAKKRLISTLSKLSKANTPLTTEQVLELAQSIYADNISTERKIVYRDIHNYPLLYLYYFPTVSAYKIILLDDTIDDKYIRSFQVLVYADNPRMEIKISTMDKHYKEKIHDYTMESESISCNIKEIQKQMNHCNKKMIGVIEDFLLNTLKDERF